MHRLASLLIAAVVVCAQAPQVVEIEVKANKQWTDSGIDVQPGDTLRINAEGTVQYVGSAKPFGPDGGQRGWKDLLRTFPINDAGRGALIGRVGDSDATRPFLIVPRRESRSTRAGRLFVGVNQPSNESAEGVFKVRIERVATTETASVDAASLVVGRVTQDQLDSVPLRVVDDAGTEGDRVNFLIVGSEEKVREALKTAGWVTVDKTVKDSIMRGALASLSRQSYTTLPMSELKMFGRSQDYGYALGDPVKVVAARHHFRIWRAPFTASGETVWVGAGTHDVGFDKDQRNGKITHRIDSDVDKERDFIGRSFLETGSVALLDYMTAKNPITKAKTAHGQEFFSDGRTLVIYLKPDRGDMSKLFADLFCSVLSKENPDGGQWDGCAKYVQTSGKQDMELAAIPNKYRVLIVPGFMSSCFSDSPAFQEGQEHLRTKYGLTVDLLQVGNDASEINAKAIADFLTEAAKQETRKFIVLGYSKGTPDVQEALVRYPDAAKAVAAFVSVAGAAGGSPIADAIPGQADRWIRDFKMMDKCKGDLSQGFKSLRRDVRQAFLSSYPHPVVPTYSLVAISGLENTSKALLKSWELLRVFDNALDGQVTKADAMIPEAKYLGAALADHFGVALPFDKAADQMVRSNMGSKYPRAALLEAMIRLVVQDLDKPR